MARARPVDIDGIIDVDSGVDLTPFITAANELVTELCTDSDYTDDRLTIIETWLSAHFYQVYDQAVANEKAGSVSVGYQFKIELNLFQTKYGQTAMLLDTAGNLAALSKRIEDGEPAGVSIIWMGEDYDTEESDS